MPNSCTASVFQQKERTVLQQHIVNGEVVWLSLVVVSHKLLSGAPTVLTAKHLHLSLNRPRCIVPIRFEVEFVIYTS